MRFIRTPFACFLALQLQIAKPGPESVHAGVESIRLH
jgi:hypothetical protein